MKCPYCGSEENRVVDKRDNPEPNTTRRRRECLDAKCAKRFTTYERIETVELTVVKKDGRREQFNREKILTGLLKACEKRPVPRESIEKAVGDIETKLRNYHTTEIDSKIIGNLIMRKLKSLDQVAYIRFASVYREFSDIEAFVREAEKFMKN